MELTGFLLEQIICQKPIRFLLELYMFFSIFNALTSFWNSAYTRIISIVKIILQRKEQYCEMADKTQFQSSFKPTRLCYPALMILTSFRQDGVAKPWEGHCHGSRQSVWVVLSLTILVTKDPKYKLSRLFLSRQRRMPPIQAQMENL